MMKEEFQNLEIRDWTLMPAEHIAELLDQAYRNYHKAGMSRSDVYCGISNDFLRRAEEHQRDHWEIKDVIAVVDCGSKDKAGKVEELLHDKYDFPITVNPSLATEEVPPGGNGSAPESTLVYMVVKGKTVAKSLPEALSNIRPLMDYLNKAINRDS